MTIKALQDRIGSMLLLVLAAVVMLESWWLSLGDVHNPGPGFVPFLLSASVAVLSLLAYFLPDRAEKPKAFWNNWPQGKNIFFIFAGLILYLLLFRALGFYVDTLWLMVYLMRLAGEKGFKRPVLLSLFTMILIYGVFAKLLTIPFPRGKLGF